MNTTGNQPVFENEAARAAYFLDRVKNIEKAKKEGDVASAEFLAKELELHKRTEALIHLFPSDTMPEEQSSIIPIYSYADASLYAEGYVVPAVRLIQKKKLGKKGEDTTYSKSTIEYLQLEEGRLPKHLAYIHGFDHKVYGHHTRPGVGAKKSIEAANGYEIQATYDTHLTELESILFDSKNEKPIQ